MTGRNDRSLKWRNLAVPLLAGGHGVGKCLGFGGDGSPILVLERLGIDERTTRGRRHGARLEESAHVFRVHSTRRHHFDVRQGPFDGLDVGWAEEFGGENLGGIGSGFPCCNDFGRSKGATEHGNAIAAAHRNDVEAQRRCNDKLGASEDAHARGFGVEHRAQTKDKVGQFSGGLFQHADGPGSGHGELDAGQPTVGESLGTVEQTVGIIGANERDNLFRAYFREHSFFFHESG